VRKVVSEGLAEATGQLFPEFIVMSDDDSFDGPCSAGRPLGRRELATCSGHIPQDPFTCPTTDWEAALPPPTRRPPTDACARPPLLLRTRPLGTNERRCRDPASVPSQTSPRVQKRTQEDDCQESPPAPAGGALRSSLRTKHRTKIFPQTSQGTAFWETA
jgi:hypothetical protein